MAKLPLKTIPLSSLTVGMHIAKLDIPWIKSPFITHSRLVKSSKDIDLLKQAGVNTIIIDPNKGENTSSSTAPTPEADTQAAVSETRKENAHTSQQTPPTDANESPAETTELNAKEKARALAHDIEQAKKVRDHVRQSISLALDKLAAGNSVDREELSPLIDKTLASIEQNNQALLNIVHSNGRTQKLADHTFSTFCLTLDLARNMQLAHEEIEALGIGALLHEAGWAHIPLHLMGKRSPYTTTERKLIEKHTVLAMRALTQCDLPALAHRIIAEHHELCNGQGYPRKLNDEQIHPLSKLFTVVDQYDERVHQLSDQNGLTPTGALRKLYLDAEKNVYDTDAVGQLIALLGVYPISSVVTLNDGSIGIVREVPANAPLQPLIEVRIDAHGNALNKPFYQDLAHTADDEQALRITQVVDLSNLPPQHQQRLQFHA